jgi:hypothetical protein
MNDVLLLVKLVEKAGVQNCDRLVQIWKSCQSRVFRRRLNAMKQTSGGCIFAAGVDRLSAKMAEY